MMMSRARYQFPRFFTTQGEQHQQFHHSFCSASAFTSRRNYSSSASSSSLLRTLRRPQQTQQQMQYATTIIAAPRAMGGSPRALSLNPFGSKANTNPDAEVQPLVYDKETVHYTGKFLGVSTDTIFFYTKVAAIGLTVYIIVWTFFAGYNYLMSFSLAAVGRLGFMAGFWSCAILFSTMVQLKKRYQINSNAVYNQAIATVMKSPEVQTFLGSYPKTGDFRAYHHSGGFKLPLLRRIRSGSYELADLLGTKPQRMQMMLLLKGDKHREALVTCDVRKMHTRVFTSSYHFQSLAVHLKDTATKEEKSMVLIGRDEDVVYKGLIETKF